MGLWPSFPHKQMLRQRFKNRLFIWDIQETNKEVIKGRGRQQVKPHTTVGNWSLIPRGRFRKMAWMASRNYIVLHFSHLSSEGAGSLYISPARPCLWLLVASSTKMAVLYREPFLMAWKCSSAPTQKTSGEQVSMQVHACGEVFLWGIKPALYLGSYETCFCKS
ncbi:hypothetical protein HJG60_009876 [Phyllostomus discolor]|uniref:Uncharacterized protein n=1 Tax=Phyllostomus discolor TaxID=89673 RepID=A0A834B8H3_9CHIR|nr:hypothetical protein HJG60_009876 [Phyllostomus discolor]